MLQQKGSVISASDLAKKFEVSRRTIFRDFNALQEINVPVTWDKYSGYGMMDGYKIPPMMFTTEELATIIVGLNFVKSQVDKKMVDDATEVELKIKSVLPSELQEFMSSLQNNTIIDPYLKYGAERKEGGNWYMISSAISQNKRIEFKYVSKSEETKVRKVDPYILVFYQDHWNVIGYSHLRGDFRNFILDQVSEVKVLDEKFSRKPKIDNEALIFRSDGFSHFIDMVVKKTVLSRLEANLPAKIIKKVDKNSELIKVNFEFENLDYINNWLLQFGDKIKIESPKELIDLRKKLLNELLENLK